MTEIRTPELQADGSIIADVYTPGATEDEPGTWATLTLIEGDPETGELYALAEPDAAPAIDVKDEPDAPALEPAPPPAHRGAVWTRDGRIDAEIEHPRYGWIPATLSPDDPDTAALYAKAEAAGPAPAPAPDLERVRRAKRREIDAAYSAELAAITDAYPEVERLTWDKQEREARAFANDDTAPTPLLDGIAAARGLALSELVARVIAKADAWVAASGTATGKRQALEAAIDAAEDVATLEAIAW